MVHFSSLFEQNLFYLEETKLCYMALLHMVEVTRINIEESMDKLLTESQQILHTQRICSLADESL